jgi:hypothetical protein
MRADRLVISGRNGRHPDLFRLPYWADGDARAWRTRPPLMSAAGIWGYRWGYRTILEVAPDDKRQQRRALRGSLQVQRLNGL